MAKYKNQLLIICFVYLLIFLAISISPYVLVSGYDSRILFFESLIATNLIVPFSINTVYLFYILSQYSFSKDENKES